MTDFAEEHRVYIHDVNVKKYLLPKYNIPAQNPPPKAEIEQQQQILFC